VSISSHQSNGANQASSPPSISQCETRTASSLSLNQATDVPRESANTENDEARIQTEQSPLHGNRLEQNLTTDRLTLRGDIGSVIVSSDLWSAAYREAIENLGDEIDIAILNGKNVAQLFKELEEIGKGVTHESAFLRGVRYLRSLQVPLERFKLALDLASPLTSFEPTAATVFGVVGGVTAVRLGS
jgi:hypothetical protein